jgi:hypothetical protein
LNLSILTVVASARNFREMRSDDRFEPIPVNCHCANLCPQLANAFRTRTEQERALRVAFGTFTKPSTNARSLRIPAGRSRRTADIADRNVECCNWGIAAVRRCGDRPNQDCSLAALTAATNFSPSSISINSGVGAGPSNAWPSAPCASASRPVFRYSSERNARHRSR